MATATRCLHKNWHVGSPPIQTHTCFDCGLVVEWRHPLEPRAAYNGEKRPPHGTKPLNPDTVIMREALFALEVDEEDWIDHSHLKCTVVVAGKGNHKFCSLEQTITRLQRQIKMRWTVKHDGNYDAIVRRVA